jgi:hypothetical protein
LNDGSIYKYPKVSPYELDVTKSKQTEPAKWGKWKLEGKTMVVQLPGNGGIKTERWEKNWFWTKPAAANEKLDVSFERIYGVGNSGGTMAVTTGNISFNNKGQFTLLRTAGVTSSEYEVHTSAYSDKKSAGTYVLDGYSIELHFNNGTVTKQLFYFFPDSRDAICIGGQVYTR